MNKRNHREFSQIHLIDQFVIDCKTVRIFAHLSTPEQSNRWSEERLKTESETGEGFLTLHTAV